MAERIRDRYEPLEVAGRGGQGEVVRALDHQHNRIVAIKTRALAGDDRRDALLSEIRVLLNLTPHPNLPLVREDFFEGDRYHMVVDWVEGKSLERLLEERGDPGLPVSSVLGYLVQVAEALDHLHGHTPPIVHQDVKPANLILNEDGRVILVDFGIAGVQGSTSSAGTQGYMAPEVAAGARATPAADVYSLAATAFCLLTGAPPEGIRPEWEGVASEGVGAIERAIRRALAVDPARRPGSAHELVEQLRAWLGADLPTGVVTFLMTDIAGSTRLWDEDAAAMSSAIAKHDALIAEAVETNEGRLLKTRGEGDSTFSVFADAASALRAAASIQRGLGAQAWPTPSPLRVRAAVHSGEAELRQGDYLGPVVNRAARIRATAAGGQVLCSLSTTELAAGRLPEGVTLTDLGSHRLKDLARPEHLFQLRHPELPDNFPPLASVDATPNNLPVQLTSFVGRAREIASGKEVVAGTRLVTFTGLGGSGKTRLALQIAAEVLEGYTGGVWLVELGPLSDPNLVPQAVASVLGVQEEAGRALVESIAAHCADKTMLIVLDTCEHLLGACAAVADTLLRACRDLRIVATSSEPLGIAGETTLAVPTLAEAESVELFVERAAQAKHGFALTEQNARAVGQVCQRLDGIPLAIELAAARVKVLAPEQIAERLDDRFRLLTGGSRTAMPHQQTMRAAMDWSYEPLSENEKALFARLAAFVGGFTLEAAEHVCTGEQIDEFEVLDLVAQLVDKSFLVAEERDGETRYRMLQTVHQYAREKLAASGEAEDVRARHLAYYLDLAERASAKLQGPDQGEWLGMLEREHDNLRAAFGSSIERSEPEAPARLACALTEFLLVRGHFREGTALLDRALEALDRSRTALRAMSLNHAGLFRSSQGDYATARALYEESLDIRRELGITIDVARSLNNLGTLADVEGETAVARALYEESLTLRRELGDEAGIVTSLTNLGTLELGAGDLARSRSFYEEALTRAIGLGTRGLIGDLLGNLGLIAFDEGDLARARESQEQSLEIRRELSDRAGIAKSLGNLGEISLSEGEPARASTLFEEALTICEEIGNQEDMPWLLRNLAEVARSAGHLNEALARCERSLKVALQIGARFEIGCSHKLLGMIWRECGELDQAGVHLEAAMTEFRSIGDAAAEKAVLAIYPGAAGPA